MLRPRVVLAALLPVIALLSTSRVCAQATPSLQLGALVRVRQAEGRATHRFVGRLVRLDQDSLVIVRAESRPECARVAIPRGAIGGVDLGHIESHVWRDATLGALVGTVAGFAVGSDEKCHSCNTDEIGAAKFYSSLIGAGIGLLGGAIVGAVVGAPRVRWSSVTLAR